MRSTGKREQTVRCDVGTQTLLLGSLFKDKFSLEEPCVLPSDCAWKTMIDAAILDAIDVMTECKKVLQQQKGADNVSLMCHFEMKSWRWGLKEATCVIGATETLCNSVGQPWILQLPFDKFRWSSTSWPLPGISSIVVPVGPCGVALLRGFSSPKRHVTSWTPCASCTSLTSGSNCTSQSRRNWNSCNF